jgi:outer membrane protein OmpA-like peptidoglycan-associated protein
VADPDGGLVADSSPAPDTTDVAVNWQPGDTLVLENFLFAFDASELIPAALPVLDTLAAYLGRNEALTVRITGHTDDQGSAGYNQRLSLARAQTIAEYLESRGISRARLQAEGKGESVPLVANDSEEGRARNRRVEVEFLK